MRGIVRERISENVYTYAAECRAKSIAEIFYPIVPSSRIRIINRPSIAKEAKINPRSRYAIKYVYNRHKTVVSRSVFLRANGRSCYLYSEFNARVFSGRAGFFPPQRDTGRFS